MQGKPGKPLRAEGDADAGGACFVLARRAAAVFSSEQLYVFHDPHNTVLIERS